MQNYEQRITSHPDILLGKLVISGTRISVETILRKLSEGMTTTDILTAYPTLTPDDIFAVLSYSADVIATENLIAS